MKRKVLFSLVACMLFFASFLTQIAYAEPPKKIPSGDSRNVSGPNSSSEEEDSGTLHSDDFESSVAGEGNNDAVAPRPPRTPAQNITMQPQPAAEQGNQTQFQPEADQGNQNQPPQRRERPLGMIRLNEYVSAFPTRMDSPSPEEGEKISVGYTWSTGYSIITTPREFELPEAKTSEFSIEGGINVKYTGVNPLPKLFVQAKNDGTQTICDKPINFASGKVKISGDPANHPKLCFELLSIYSGDVTFENIDIEGRIDVTNIGNVTFKNCTLYSTNINPNVTNNFLLQFSKRSHGSFENCQIKGNRKHMCYVSGASIVDFYNCTLSSAWKNDVGSTDFGSIIVVGNKKYKGPSFLWSPDYEVNSVIKIDRCKFFDSPQSYALFLIGNSDATITNSEFSNLYSSVVANINSSIDVSNSKVSTTYFNLGDARPSICLNSSKGRINNCHFTNEGGIYAAASSKMSVFDCTFNNLRKNGINCNKSTAEVARCKFNSNYTCPDVVVLDDSDLKISDCIMKRNPINPLGALAISIRSYSKAVLEDITIDGHSSKYFGIICADFSESSIKNIKFSDSAEFPCISVFNGAKVKGEAASPRHKLVLLNYDENSIYHRIIDNNDFMSKFNPQESLIIENKTGGRFEFTRDVDKATIEEFSITPSMLVPKVKFSKLIEDEELGNRHDRLISILCGHTINLCKTCGNLCNYEEAKGDDPKDEVKMHCEKCNNEFSIKTDSPCAVCGCIVCKLLKIYENDESGLCAVCNANPATNIFLPCGHKCACDACAKRWWSNGASKCVFGCPGRGYRRDFFPHHK